jgi:CRP/FNR family transcriptional regulator, cyclic AMP receptor protein
MAKDKRRKSAFDPATLLTGRGAGQSRVSFVPDQVVYPQGSHADAMFYVESGRVKISVVSPTGKEAVVGIRREGEFFGARCLIDRRTGTATALTACSLIRVTKSALTRLLREAPDFAVMFATFLVQQSINDQESIVDHLTNPAEKRLARTLLQLATIAEGEGPHPISTPISQAVLASMIGTTRSRVSFFMNKFKRQGFLTYDRHGQVSVRNALRSALLEQ